MKIGQTTEAGLYPVEYEKHASTPRETLLNEAVLVDISLSLPPSTVQRLAVSDERDSQNTDLALRIREAEANPDLKLLDFSDLLRHEGRSELPSIHLHSATDLALIADALQLFVRETPQYLAYMESRNAQREDYSTRRGAAKRAEAMNTQIHSLLGVTTLSLISAETSSQTPEMPLNTGHYL